MKVGVKNSRVKGLKKKSFQSKNLNSALLALSLSLDQKKPFDLQTNELKRKKNFIKAFFFFEVSNCNHSYFENLHWQFYVVTFGSIMVMH